MIKRFSIRTQLLAAFTIDIVLLIALGTFATVQMANMSQNTAFVEQYTFPSRDLSDQINGLITRYRVLQFEFVLNASDADRARIESDMSVVEAEMQAAFNAYIPLATNENERAALEAVFLAWDDFVVATRERFIPSAQLTSGGSVQPALNRLNPLYQALDLASDDLVAINQSQATQALAEVRSAFGTARTFIIGDTILTVLISAGIGLWLSGRLARRVRRLTRATREVADGDLSQPVEIGGRDEVGELATNFNLMVVALHEERQRLRERNADLAESLAQQQRLNEELVARQASEAAAQQARLSAEAASQAKTMFIATMSHELRTPLNAILGYTQLLHLRAKSNQDTATLHQLGRIEIAGKHLLTLVSNVLDFAKIEQGRMERECIAFNVAELVDATAAVIEPLAAEHGNQLLVTVASDLGQMHSDPNKLRQILFNLLANACKFTENGIVRLDVALLNHAQIQFTIEDSGIGMDQMALERIFAPFTQADSSTTRRFGGTGLGLSLSRELAHLLGGSIAVTSELGVGTRFVVTLPCLD